VSIGVSRMETRCQTPGFSLMKLGVCGLRLSPPSFQTQKETHKRLLFLLYQSQTPEAKDPQEYRHNGQSGTKDHQLTRQDIIRVHLLGHGEG